MTTISPEICQVCQRRKTQRRFVETYAREAVHRISSSDAARAHLMCDHRAETNSYCDPWESNVCCPAVEHVTQAGVDEAGTKRPESHFRFFDTPVAASEEDDNRVCENAGEITKYASDQCGEEHQSCSSGGKVVRFSTHDLGDCPKSAIDPYDGCVFSMRTRVEGDDACRTSESEDDTSLQRISDLLIF